MTYVYLFAASLSVLISISLVARGGNLGKLVEKEQGNILNLEIHDYWKPNRREGSRSENPGLPSVLFYFIFCLCLSVAYASFSLMLDL